jgi:hypothetical protein
MTDLPTSAQLVAVFHAAVRAGDADGVDAALRVMVVVDPRKAVELYDALKTAVAVAPYIKELKT